MGEIIQGCQYLDEALCGKGKRIGRLDKREGLLIHIELMPTHFSLCIQPCLYPKPQFVKFPPRRAIYPYPFIQHFATRHSLYIPHIQSATLHAYPYAYTSRPRSRRYDRPSAQYTTYVQPPKPSSSLSNLL